MGLIFYLYFILTYSHWANGLFFREFYHKLREVQKLPSGRTKDLPSLLHREWDFIVIGAGSAGAAVANRLSENSNWNVLLLEAGREDIFILNIPVTVGFLQYTDFNWGYSTVPQHYACLSIKNHACPQPRGKGLGGTSNLNYMIYTRCHPDDFHNKTSWSFDKLLPYYIKNERTNIPELQTADYRGKSGPIPVGYPPWKTKLFDGYLEAGKSMGYRTNIDYNVPENNLGIGRIQTTQIFGRRVSTAQGYLNRTTVFKRNNLAIVANARVTKIIIERHPTHPSIMRASGVFVTYRKKEYYIKTKKEIILSAGAINSPQLLMLSGIGPREHLSSLNIPVMIDLPVGETLIDHPGVLAPIFIINTTDSIRIENITSIEGFKQYIEGTGPLVSAGGVEGIGYFQTKYARDRRPDIELMFSGGTIAADDGLIQARNWGIDKDIYESYFGSIKGKHGFMFLPMMQHPKSKGNLRLKSNNPWKWPLIDSKLLSDPFDVATLVEGIKLGIKLGENEAFKKFDAKLFTPDIPQCRHLEYLSDEFWECHVRYLTAWWHHQVGTCAIDDVVDDELRVFGMSNLRVVDGSVLKYPPTCHTHSISMVIGERGADFIKNTWKTQ